VPLNEQRLHTPWQQKVFTKLLGFNYRIVYKKGVENTVADSLTCWHGVLYGDFILSALVVGPTVCKL
jgi:hypothetical protein